MRFQYCYSNYFNVWSAYNNCLWLINRKITVLIRNFPYKDYVIIYILVSLRSSSHFDVYKSISTFSYIFMDFQAHGTASFTMAIHDICWFIVYQEIIGCSTLRKMWWHSSICFNPGKNCLEKRKLLLVYCFLSI